MNKHDQLAPTRTPQESDDVLGPEPGEPSVPLGCGELYARMHQVITCAGAQRRTLPPSNTRTAVAFTEHASLDLHGSVQQGLGIDVSRIEDTLRRGQVAQVSYASFGFALTTMATLLASYAQMFEENWPWGEAVTTAYRLVRTSSPTAEDRRLSDTALLAMLRAAARHPVSVIAPVPGWRPGITPLFVDGYPTSLLAHAAAELRVNAVRATQLGAVDANDLFHALGWHLSPRARKVAMLAQDHTASGESWDTAIDAAEQATVAHLPRRALDR